MQNKHQKKIFVGGVPTSRKGGGSSRLGQNPKFTQKNYWTAPLISSEGALISSEGALIAITPYDYPQGKPLFEHTPALDNNLNIIAMMTLVTIISMINKITKITRNIK